MSTYTPDSWVIVKIQSEKYGTIYKVLAGWSGSYLYGASWKLSSGIVTFEDKGSIMNPCKILEVPTFCIRVQRE